MKRFLPAVLLSAALFLPQHSIADENDRTLTVRSSAAKDVDPDVAVLTFAVETMAPTAKESAAANARTADNVIRSVKRALGQTDEVDTSSFSVFPVYEYEKARGQVLKGFRTTNQVTVTTDKIASTGEILDRAIEAGANRVVDVRFDIKNISGHCEGLIREAASKAASQAKAASSAFGTSLDGVKTIVPSCHKEANGPVRPYGAELMKMAAPDTPVEPGTVRLRAEVEAVYFLGGRL